MPVHLFGQPVDIAAIKAVCDKHNLKLIEDCAQSFGASIAGKQTGGIGNAAGYSFFPSKNLGAFGDANISSRRSESKVY
jgi:dTDP-4-amino-4,6-dideoxygalactose transaminase